MNKSSSTPQGLAKHWRRWRQPRSQERATRGEDFIGPLLQPVWPGWVDVAQAPRRRREPQRSDPPRRAHAGGCGWFESSHELRGGLEVREEMLLELPGPDELDRTLRFV
ncbi:hypothetical protein [Rivibacter subsaxonicus]|uniref:hypothetical protein n=1 Tax=Rivibacter subsaxonicus TaxID=457575 RepID=UPI00102C041D|nr:hypothetical protein [Rivibacter subsaxonicus]